MAGRIHTLHINTLLLVVGSALLIACSSGSDSSGAPPSTTPATAEQPALSKVVFEFYNDQALTVPFTGGVSVFVYGDDTQTIDRIAEVGASGEVALGEFEEALSITFAYRAPPQSFVALVPATGELVLNELNIRSLVNLPLSALVEEEGVYYLRLHVNAAADGARRVANGMTLSSRVSALPVPPEGSIDTVILNVFPWPRSSAESALTVNGSPSYSIRNYSFLNDEVLIDNFAVAANQSQDDGTLSFLSTVETRSGQELLQYGFLLDQAAQDNGYFVIDADLVPLNIPLEIAGFDPPVADGLVSAGSQLSVEIFGLRKGLPYTVLPYRTFNISTANLDNLSTEIALADQFPVDSYVTSLNYSWGSISADVTIASGLIDSSSFNQCTKLAKNPEVPNQLTAKPVVISYDTLAFDRDERRVSWSNNAAEQVQWQEFSIRPSSDNPVFAHFFWKVEFDSSENSILLPRLPEKLMTEVAAIIALPSQNFRITAYDHMPSLNPEHFVTSIGALDGAVQRSTCVRDEFTFE